MCNQDHLQNISLTSLNGYLSRRIEAYIATLLRPYGLGVEQMIALMILAKNSDIFGDECQKHKKNSCMNVSQLSEFLLKDKTTTSRLITSLEQKGFVKKCYDRKKDKRIVYVELTKQGEEKCKEIGSSNVKSQTDEIFEKALDKNEKEAFKKLLLKILEVLDEKAK